MDAQGDANRYPNRRMATLPATLLVMIADLENARLISEEFAHRVFTKIPMPTEFLHAVVRFSVLWRPALRRDSRKEVLSDRIACALPSVCRRPNDAEV